MSDENDLDAVLSEYEAIDMSLYDDFGFTTVGEEEYQQAIVEASSEAASQAESETVAEYKAKLLEVEKLILPFLIKLLNAKETYIKWPHESRGPTIKAQIEKIVDITRS